MQENKLGTGVFALFSGQAWMTQSGAREFLCLQNCFGPVQNVSLVPVLFPHLSGHCYDKYRFSWLFSQFLYWENLLTVDFLSLSSIVHTGWVSGMFQSLAQTHGTTCNSPKLLGGRTTSWTLSWEERKPATCIQTWRLLWRDPRVSQKLQQLILHRL